MSQEEKIKFTIILKYVLKKYKRESKYLGDTSLNIPAQPKSLDTFDQIDISKLRIRVEDLEKFQK